MDNIQERNGVGEYKVELLFIYSQNILIKWRPNVKAILYEDVTISHDTFASIVVTT